MSKDKSNKQGENEKLENAVIYARYSSEKQNEQSIEGQLRICNKYAKDHNMNIVETYIDRAKSGTTDNRVSFQKMIADSSKKQWKYVLVYKLDRFSRNKYESAIHKHTLKQNGVKLISAMEDIPDKPEGIIFESILEGMNEYYSAELSQKVKRGMRESLLKGRFIFGAPPYGYDVTAEHKLVINETEAAHIRYIFELYLSGNDVPTIHQIITSKHILTKRQKPFCVSALYRILDNEHYTGRFDFQGESYPDVFPRIIADDVFFNVNKIFQEHMCDKGYKNSKKFLLSPKLYCGQCNTRMVGTSGTAHSGKVTRYYRCPNKDCDKKSYVPQEALDMTVMSAINCLLQSPENLEFAANKLVEKHMGQKIENAYLDSLKKDRKTKKKQLDALVNAIMNGLDITTIHDQVIELENNIKYIEEQIEFESAKQNKCLDKDEMISYITNFLNTNKASEHFNKLVLNTLVNKIMLYPNKLIIVLNVTNDDRSPLTDDEKALIDKNGNLPAHCRNSKLINGGSPKGDFNSLFLLTISCKQYLAI